MLLWIDISYVLNLYFSITSLILNNVTQIWITEGTLGEHAVHLHFANRLGQFKLVTVMDRYLRLSLLSRLDILS